MCEEIIEIKRTELKNGWNEPQMGMAQVKIGWSGETAQNNLAQVEGNLVGGTTVYCK